MEDLRKNKKKNLIFLLSSIVFTKFSSNHEENI